VKWIVLATLLASAGCACQASAPTRAFCDDVEKLLSVSVPAKGADPEKWAKTVAIVVSNARAVKELHP
jgi:hypothetical protein